MATEKLDLSDKTVTLLLETVPQLYFEAKPLFAGDRIQDWQKFHLPVSFLLIGFQLPKTAPARAPEQFTELFRKYSRPVMRMRGAKPDPEELEALDLFFLGSLGDVDYYVDITRDAQDPSASSELFGRVSFTSWAPAGRKSLDLFPADQQALNSWLTIALP